MQTIDPSTPYWMGPATVQKALVAAGPTLNGTLTYQGSGIQPLTFYVTQSTHSLTKKNICTSYQLADTCLDQLGNNVTPVAFQRPGFYTGQEWTLTSSFNAASGNTFWKLQSDFAGPSRYLAVDLDGENLIMSSTASEIDTLWLFIPATSDSTSSVSRSPVATSSTSITSARSTANIVTVTVKDPTTTTTATTSAATQSGTSNNTGRASSMSVPKGAAAGIVFGAALFFGAILS